MRLLYLANMSFPSERAHAKQVREMCNAFAGLSPISVVVPTRMMPESAQAFGLDPRVKLVHILTPDLVRFGWFGFHFTSLWFAIGAALYARFYFEPVSIITREFQCAYMTALLRLPTLWEAHRGEWNWLIRGALGFGARIIAISNGLKEFYLEKGIPEPSVFVAPDGVDLERYKNLPTREAARAELGLSKDTVIALYNGHLYATKGAATLADAAAFLPESYQVMLMGGTDEDIAAFRQRYAGNPRVQVIGRKPDNVRPLYLRAANVALLPNTGDDEISARFTSPLKLFGYMAAGTPILASDLPSIREILDEESAYFAEAGNANSFAEQIMAIGSDPDAAARKGTKVGQMVAQYGWNERAKRIQNFFAVSR